MDKHYLPINYIERGRTVKWVHPDSEERFNTAINIDPTNLDLINYSNNPIEYKFNNYGLRTPDNLDPVSVGNVYLGCSHTFAIGLHLEDTWGYKVNKEIGGAFFNFAQPGTGILTGYRLLKYWVDRLDIQNVFAFYPHQNRYEYYSPKEELFRTLTENIPGVSKETVSIINHKNNYELLTELGYLGIKSICENKNINFTFLNEIKFIPKTDTEFKYNSARDQAHLEPRTQNDISIEFLNTYNSKL